MTRYHLLLAGKFWIDEYGDPDDPKMNSVIRAYSPYQNVKQEIRYPLAFVNTSTKDDRVHPGHARKLVAKLESLGHPVLYYENIEGGHAGGADLLQLVHVKSLEFTYLIQRLMKH